MSGLRIYEQSDRLARRGATLPGPSRLRIGLVIERFDPQRGGVEQWTWQFAKWMLAAGHEPHVFARSFAPEAIGVGIVPHLVPPCRSRVAYAAAVEQEIRRHDLDVVHDNGYGWSCDVFQPHGGSRRASFEQNLLLSPLLIRAVKRQAARWLTRHDEFRQLVDRQYRDRDRIYMPISRMVADHMLRYHGVPASQMRLVYNGVDLERFSPEHRDVYRRPIRQQLGIREQQVMLLIVAHNFRLKGVRTLMRAAAQLSAAGKDLHVVVVGGKHLDFWRRRARWLGLADKITFLGRIDDPVPYYAAADAYVQPTFYDPCSLVVLEALASGLPVVTSQFNGVSELLTQGREGYVILDPADHRELAEALLPMFSPTRRAAMGKAARALALHHPLERNCREILEVYQEIVSRKLARAA